MNGNSKYYNTQFATSAIEGLIVEVRTSPRNPVDPKGRFATHNVCRPECRRVQKWNVVNR